MAGVCLWDIIAVQQRRTAGQGCGECHSTSHPTLKIMFFPVRVAINLTSRLCCHEERWHLNLSAAGSSSAGCPLLTVFQLFHTILLFNTAWTYQIHTSGWSAAPLGSLQTRVGHSCRKMLHLHASHALGYKNQAPLWEQSSSPASRGRMQTSKPVMKMNYGGQWQLQFLQECKDLHQQTFDLHHLCWQHQEISTDALKHISISENPDYIVKKNPEVLFFPLCSTIWVYKWEAPCLSVPTP